MRIERAGRIRTSDMELERSSSTFLIYHWQMQHMALQPRPETDAALEPALHRLQWHHADDDVAHDQRISSTTAIGSSRSTDNANECRSLKSCYMTYFGYPAVIATVHMHWWWFLLILVVQNCSLSSAEKCANGCLQFSSRPWPLSTPPGSCSLDVNYFWYPSTSFYMPCPAGCYCLGGWGYNCDACLGEVRRLLGEDGNTNINSSM